MAFSISPAVIVNEIDATATIPSTYGQRGAIAGVFNWGPVGEPTLITSENELVSVFGKPTSNNAETFFTAANFLAYTTGLYVNRADAGATVAAGASYFNAKYPGEIGNSLGVSYVSTAGYENEIAAVGSASGTITFGSYSITINTSANEFANIVPGDVLKIGNDVVGYQYLTVASVVDGGQDPGSLLYALTITFNKPFAVAETDASALQFVRLWAYHKNSGKAPANNRVHIVVYDRLGQITGSIGTVLETYIDVSLDPTAKSDTNESIYYRNVLLSSKWIAAANDEVVANANTNNIPLTGAVAGSSESTVAFGAVALAYDPFRNAEEYNVAFVLQGKAIGGANATGIANYIVENIANIRKDCRAFLSPSKQASVDAVTVSDKLTAIVNYRSSVNSSSYWHMDSGYKQQYDKYNDVYRWVPLNGDCAGLYARVEPWESGAGYEKGIIKNVYKLSLNPNKEHRDTLFAADINPVMSEVGFGTLLFGDKTGIGTGSAFNRQNVRGLFIYLEKEIATASKMFMFQFNDAFTQTRFKNMVEPKLRLIQGRRGLIDYRVICDSTVNTPDVIDANMFNGKIFIKPSKTISYIVLDFINTPTGIEFEELIGQV